MTGGRMIRWIRLARDEFWRAFWRRQKKYLPPAAQVFVANNLFKERSKLHVVVGRDWDEHAERGHIELVDVTNSEIVSNAFVGDGA